MDQVLLDFFMTVCDSGRLWCGNVCLGRMLDQVLLDFFMTVCDSGRLWCGNVCLGHMFDQVLLECALGLLIISPSCTILPGAGSGQCRLWPLLLSLKHNLLALMQTRGLYSTHRAVRRRQWLVPVAFIVIIAPATSHTFTTASSGVLGWGCQFLFLLPWHPDFPQ